MPSAAVGGKPSSRLRFHCAGRGQPQTVLHASSAARHARLLPSDRRERRHQRAPPRQFGPTPRHLREVKSPTVAEASTRTAPTLHQPGQRHLSAIPETEGSRLHKGYLNPRSLTVEWIRNFRCEELRKRREKISASASATPDERKVVFPVSGKQCQKKELSRFSTSKNTRSVIVVLCGGGEQCGCGDPTALPASGKTTEPA